LASAVGNVNILPFGLSLGLVSFISSFARLTKRMQRLILALGVLSFVSCLGECFDGAQWSVGRSVGGPAGDRNLIRPLGTVKRRRPLLAQKQKCRRCPETAHRNTQKI